jgi:ribose transport system substrate-binding protein
MKKGITMDNRKKSLLLLVLGGLSSIVFLTLLTTSFYGFVLKRIGVEHAENTDTIMS